MHIGSKVPDYIYTCIQQVQRYCNNRIIIYAPDSSEALKNFQSFKNVLFLGAITKTDNWKEFQEVQQLSQFGMNNFWRYACERFYAIESIMETLGIDNALHIENDNLIYGEPDTEFLKDYCKDGIGLTRITDKLLSAGIMYIGSRNKLKQMNGVINFIIQLRPDLLNSLYGESMINEMFLLHICSLMRKDTIHLLPMVPGIYCSEYIYDCASWGQYVGGTNQFPDVSYHESNHIVGEMIGAGTIDLVFKKGEKGKIPIAINKIDNLENPLFNLHIHSKKLSKWT